MTRALRLGPAPVLAHRARLALAAVVLLALGFFAGTLATGPGRERFAFLYEDFTIDTCLRQREVVPADLVGTTEAVQACYEKLRLQGALNEFQVRRVNFQSQYFADAVVMWMVVTMTLSGVGLAAYQIVVAAKLSPGSMPESELAVERGRLFVRSSVTGLMILVVSFAFFFTYVVYVYTIYEVGEDPPLTAAPAEPSLFGPALPLEGALLEDPAGGAPAE